MAKPASAASKRPRKSTPKAPSTPKRKGGRFPKVEPDPDELEDDGDDELDDEVDDDSDEDLEDEDLEDDELEDDVDDEPDDDELDEEDEEDDDELEDDDEAEYAVDREVAASLKRAAELGQGAPWLIRVRSCSNTSGLRPVRGTIDFSEVTAAGGSLEQALRRCVKDAPGRYALELYDPTGKAKSAWRRFLSIAPPVAPRDVREIETKTQTVRAKQKLEEALADLEAARDSRNGTKNDAIVGALHALSARVDEIASTPKRSIFTDLFGASAGTVGGAALVALVKKVLAPAPSPTALIGELAPLLQAVMTGNLDARNARLKAELSREEMLLEQLVTMARKNNGAADPEEDDESPLGLVKGLLSLFRKPSGVATPGGDRATVPPTVRPRPALRMVPRARVERTAEERFLRIALVCGEQQVPLESALERVLPAWSALSDESRELLLGDPAQLDGLIAKVSQPVLLRLQAFLQNGGAPWTEQLVGALRQLEEDVTDEDAGPHDGADATADVDAPAESVTADAGGA